MRTFKPLNGTVHVVKVENKKTEVENDSLIFAPTSEVKEEYAIYKVVSLPGVDLDINPGDHIICRPVTVETIEVGNYKISIVPRNLIIGVLS